MTSPRPIFPPPPPAPSASPELLPLALAPLPIDILHAASDADRHAGRDAVRSAVLAMHPVDGDNLLLPGPLGRVSAPAGAFWALRTPNGLHVALRAASFRSIHAARDDALILLCHAAELDEVLVRSSDGKRYSHWYTLRRRVVLVSGQAWNRPTRGNGRAIREIVAQLPRM